MQNLYAQALLTSLDVYAHMFGERWVIDQCHSYTLKCLRDSNPVKKQDIISIETDSLYDDDEVEIVSPVELPSRPLTPPPPSPPTPPPEPTPQPEPQYKILRVKKSPPVVQGSPQAKQNLVETLKKSSSVAKKKSVIRDINKLVKQGLLPVGSKVVPSASEVSPDVYGIIQLNSAGKVGIQLSWSPETILVGKANAPTQFLNAINKQFSAYKRYDRENAWNDLLKVNPGGSYVSLADLWIQVR